MYNVGKVSFFPYIDAFSLISERSVNETVVVGLQFIAQHAGFYKPFCANFLFQMKDARARSI
jgi:hypothetical protein